DVAQRRRALAESDADRASTDGTERSVLHPRGAGADQRLSPRADALVGDGAEHVRHLRRRRAGWRRWICCRTFRLAVWFQNLWRHWNRLLPGVDLDLAGSN